MTSVNFDRAAGFYDQTRGMPAYIAGEMASLALELIGPGAHVLEIGVGTGRIAKPLLSHGLRLIGIDLSRKMMAHIRSDRPDAKLINGDIIRLPLKSTQFDAVIAVHILHLVSDWQIALAEARRMLRPGGALLLGRNDRASHSAPNVIGDMREHLRGFLDARGIRTRAIGAIEDEVRQALLASGARVEERRTQGWSTHMTLAADIDGVSNRLWSNLWSVPDDALADGVAELRRYAIQRFGSTDVAVEGEQHFVWQRFTWA